MQCSVSVYVLQCHSNAVFSLFVRVLEIALCSFSLCVTVLSAVRGRQSDEEGDVLK